MAGKSTRQTTEKVSIHNHQAREAATLMSHEQSETVKINRRWYNLDTVGADKGRILGNKKGFATVKGAVAAAKKRSRLYEVPKKTTRHQIKLGERPK